MENMLSELSYETFSNISRVTSENITPMMDVPPSITGVTDPTEMSRVRVSITISFTQMFRKPKDELTEEDIEMTKKICYNKIQKPALSEEQFKELKRQIAAMRW